MYVHTHLECMPTNTHAPLEVLVHGETWTRTHTQPHTSANAPIDVLTCMQILHVHTFICKGKYTQKHETADIAT